MANCASISPTMFCGISKPAGTDAGNFYLECADMSALWNRATCRPEEKRCHATALQNRRTNPTRKAHQSSHLLEGRTAQGSRSGNFNLRFLAPADVNLLLGMIQDFESSAAQHRFGTGAVGNPPVGRVVGVFLFDEIHAWKAGPVKHVLFVE